MISNNFSKANQIFSDPTQRDTSSRNECVAILNSYLNSRTNGIASSASGKDKQVILNAIKGMNLSQEDAQQILEGQRGLSVDNKLIRDVLDQLRGDHRSVTFFHYKNTKSYEVAIEYLNTIHSGNRGVIMKQGKGGFGLFGGSQYFIASKGYTMNEYSIERAIKADANLRDVKITRPYLERLILSGVTNLANTDLSTEDLSGLNLQELNLRGANLQEANLRESSLQGVNLEGAYLEGARLDRGNIEQAIQARANLLGVNLSGQNLAKLNLAGVNLRGANLRGADLREANLEGANLEGADLEGANLEGVNLRDANLTRANLKMVNLRRAILRGVNLEGAILKDINLVNADLRWANLKGADLQGVNLAHGNLQWANLQGAKLQKANLQEANLMQVKLRGVNLQGTVLSAKTDITLNFEDNNLDLLFNHLHNRSGSILTAINSIDNGYPDIKIKLMNQALNYLHDKNITSIMEPLRNILFDGNFDYSKSLLGNKEFSKKLVSRTIEKGNKEPLSFSDLELSFLLTYLENNSKELPDIMVNKNNFFIQLIYHGKNSGKESIKESAYRLYCKYLEDYHDVLAAHDSVCKTFELDKDDKEKLLTFKNGQNCLVVDFDYLGKFVYGKAIVSSWENIMLYRDGVLVQEPDLGEVFQKFTLFLAGYRFEQQKNLFKKLFDLINLSDLKKDFMTAIERKNSAVKFVNSNAQVKLHGIFNQLLDPNEACSLAQQTAKNIHLKEEHLRDILKAYDMTAKSNHQKAKLLLLLSGIFAKLSSSKFFGEEGNSPTALRYYAYGLMKAAYRFNKTVVDNGNFNDWENRFLGLTSNAFTCTAVLSDMILYKCKNFDDFNRNFAGIIPPAW